jgi:hypothetical protein
MPWRWWMPISVKRYKYVISALFFLSSVCILSPDLSQSSREELQTGNNIDLSKASEAIAELRSAINDGLEDVRAWGGEFPWERASASVNCWKF